jgi:hypothetical protein
LQDQRIGPCFWFSLLATGITGTALADEPTSGFLDGASLEVLSRNFYLNSDYRSPSPTGKSYKAEWAQGFISAFESGFTPGTVGLGLDAHAFLGLKLDSGKAVPGPACCQSTATAACSSTIQRWRCESSSRPQTPRCPLVK